MMKRVLLLLSFLIVATSMIAQKGEYRFECSPCEKEFLGGKNVTVRCFDGINVYQGTKLVAKVPAPADVYYKDGRVHLMTLTRLDEYEGYPTRVSPPFKSVVKSDYSNYATFDEIHEELKACGVCSGSAAGEALALIETHEEEDEDISSENELGSITDNSDGSYTYDDGQGNTYDFNGGWTVATTNADGSITLTYPDGSTFDIPADCCPTLVKNADGTYAFTSGDGSTVIIDFPFTIVTSSDSSVDITTTVSGNVTTHDLSVDIPDPFTCEDLEDCEVIESVDTKTVTINGKDYYEIKFTYADGTEFDALVPLGSDFIETVTTDTFFGLADSDKIELTHQYTDENGVFHDDKFQITCNELLALNCLPPLAFRDHDSTEINTPITLSWAGNDIGQDSPLDLGSLNYVSASANGGTFTDNGNGTFTYTPPLNFVGCDSIPYTVDDIDNGETSNIAYQVVCIKPATPTRISSIDDSELETIRYRYQSLDCEGSPINLATAEHCTDWHFEDADRMYATDGSEISRTVNFRTAKIATICQVGSTLTFDWTGSPITDASDQALIEAEFNGISTGFNSNKYNIDSVLKGRIRDFGNSREGGVVPQTFPYDEITEGWAVVGSGTKWLKQLGFQQTYKSWIGRGDNFTEVYEEGAEWVFVNETVTQNDGACVGTTSIVENANLTVCKGIKRTKATVSNMDAGNNKPVNRLESFIQTYFHGQGDWHFSTSIIWNDFPSWQGANANSWFDLGDGSGQVSWTPPNITAQFNNTTPSGDYKSSYFLETNEGLTSYGEMLTRTPYTCPNGGGFRQAATKNTWREIRVDQNYKRIGRRSAYLTYGATPFLLVERQITVNNNNGSNRLTTVSTNGVGNANAQDCASPALYAPIWVNYYPQYIRINETNTEDANYIIDVNGSGETLKSTVQSKIVETF